MSKYFIENDTFRVNFDDGQWVDIKKELSQRDQDYIINAMTKNKNVNAPNIEMSLGRQALLEVAVTAWSFTDDDNKSVPVNPDNLSNLRNIYRIKVLSEIDRLNTEANTFLKN
jgi:hypothetical protein